MNRRLLLAVAAPIFVACGSRIPIASLEPQDPTLETPDPGPPFALPPVSDASSDALQSPPVEDAADEWVTITGGACAGLTCGASCSSCSPDDSTCVPQPWACTADGICAPEAGVCP